MRLSFYGLLAVFLSSTAFADPVVSLVCEHNGGVNTESGRMDGLFGEVFDFSIDLSRENIVAGFEYADKKIMIIDEHSIKITVSYGEPSDSETYSYLVNRFTGTLFVKRIVSYSGTSHAWVAKGQCVTSDKVF